MPAYRYQKGGKTMWYAKVNFQDTEGINRQHCKRGFKTRKDAEAYETEYKAALQLCPQKGVQSLSEVLQAILNAHNVSIPTDATKPAEAVKTPVEAVRTFQTVFDEYWATTDARGLAEGTKETKINMLTKHVLPYFQDYQIADITASIVQQWQAEMRTKKRRGKSFSETYLHSIQSQLNAILNYAVRKGYIAYSPMVDLKNMGSKDAPPREIWTIDEYKRFAEYAKQRPKTYILCQLYFWLGLRRGEGLSIRQESIFMDTRTGTKMLRIDTSIDAKGRVGLTKTNSSYRTIPLPKFIDEELTAYMNTIYGLKPSDRIFEEITVSQLTKDVKWAIKQSGVPDICIHGMRHSAASMLISSSSSELTYTDVADILGHRSAKTTMHTYSHILPTTKSAVANLIESMHDD